MQEIERARFEAWKQKLHDNWDSGAGHQRYVIGRMMFAPPSVARQL